MTRRDLIRSLAAAPGISRAAARVPPNIVLLVADDLGWGDVGFHGSEIRTPHLDRLARQGVELHRFYSAPVCSPTRAGLLTGRYPIRFGMMHWPIAPYDMHGLPPEELTLPEALATAGYERRAVCGKWHLGHVSPKYHPLNQGFTHFYGHLNGYIDYFTHQREGEVDWHRQWEPSNDEGHATDLMADEAVRFLRQSEAGVPFFLYVPFAAPHTPLQAPESFVRQYHDLPEPRRTLAAMVTHMDAAIGRILAALDDKALADNTLVLFFSDNGGTGANLPLRGRKAQAFEGGIRVPAAIRWPRGLRGGRRHDGPFAYIDVMPTLLRLAGVRTDAGRPLDGQDVWDEVTGERPRRPRDLFSFVGSEERESLALMEGDWKLVRVGPTILREASEGQVYLFRIDEDPWEERDLAKEQPERTRRMLARLREFRKLHPPSIRIHTGGDKNKPAGWQAPPRWLIKQ